MKTMKRSLAFIMAFTMMLCYCFSTTAITEDQIKAKFQLVKVSETTDEVILNINLAKGNIKCFDMQISVGESLECTSIVRSSELRALDIDGLTFAANAANGKISLASPTAIDFETSTPMFVCKYKKLVADGVKSSDFTLDVEECRTKNGSVDEDITAFTVVENTVPATHAHVAGGDFVTTESSTCTKQGTQVKYCTECGDIALSESLQLADHTLVPSHKDANCEEDGYDKQTCSVCEQEITSTILYATGHTEKTTTVSPDCENGGYSVTVCTVCEKELRREPISPTGHTTATRTISPKCEEEGYTITYCTVCEKELKRDTIDPTGHINTKSEIIDPTCTEDGKIEVYCNDCEKVVDSSILTATGHHYVQINKDATCEEDGYTGIECTACKHQKSYNVVSKLGHKWGAWKTVKSATYSEEGLKERTCSTCHKAESQTIPVLIVKPVSIAILPENDITLKYGKSTQLYGNILPAEAAYSNTITWESTDEKILTVDENGVVTAVGFGSATIIASTADGKVTTKKNIKVEFSLWQWLVKLILGWITGKK